MKTLTDILTEGAWGYGSLDNDYVLDDRDELMAKLHKNFMSKIKQNLQETQNCWNNIGLIDWYCESMIALKQDYWLYEDRYKVFEIYQKSIDTVCQDTDWINDWSEPEKMQDALAFAREKLIKHQEALEKSHKGKSRIKYKIATDNN
jgi:hypothetical protein